VWLWCVSSVNPHRPWRPLKAVQTAEPASVTSASNSTTPGGLPAPSTNTCSPPWTSGQRWDADYLSYLEVQDLITNNLTWNCIRRPFYFPTMTHYQAKQNIQMQILFIVHHKVSFHISRCWHVQNMIRRGCSFTVSPVRCFFVHFVNCAESIRVTRSRPSPKPTRVSRYVFNSPLWNNWLHLINLPCFFFF